jgi:hypothetical protein
LNRKLVLAVLGLVLVACGGSGTAAKTCRYSDFATDKTYAYAPDDAGSCDLPAPAFSVDANGVTHEGRQVLPDDAEEVSPGE